MDDARRPRGGEYATPDSRQTLGYYLGLCDFLGFWDCCTVLQRRIDAAPDGERTLCQTPHRQMVQALLDAQIKSLIESGKAKFVTHPDEMALRNSPSEDGPEWPDDWVGENEE